MFRTEDQLEIQRELRIGRHAEVKGSSSIHFGILGSIKLDVQQEARFAKRKRNISRGEVLLNGFRRSDVAEKIETAARCSGQMFLKVYRAKLSTKV